MRPIQPFPRASALLCCMAIVTTGLLGACGNAGVLAGVTPVPPPVMMPPVAVPPIVTPPVVTPIAPGSSQSSVAQDAAVSVNFSASMNPYTINNDSFSVRDSVGVLVSGFVFYDSSSHLATFRPQAALRRGEKYSVNLSSAVQDSGGTSISPLAYSFVVAAGPAPVNLGTAGQFAILAKSGVSSTGTTSVTGDLGLSPAAGTYYTGFSDSLDASNTFSTSAFVTGRLYAASMASPTPVKLTTAVGDMAAAYTDAAGRANPSSSELAAGQLGGLTLQPGLYKWSSAVGAASDLTLTGGVNDTFIFQVAQTLNLASGVHVTLAGGLQPKNITWVVAGAVTLGTGSDLEGVVLGQTGVVLQTGAVMHGRALSQTAVTLDASTLTAP